MLREIVVFVVYVCGLLYYIPILSIFTLMLLKDPPDQEPKSHEPGGKYATGINILN
jgi:hypothetical protein